MSLSVVIPSKTASNLIPCVQAIRRHEAAGDVTIIVIDDGIDWIGSDFARYAPTTKNTLYSLPDKSRSSSREIATSAFGHLALTTSS